MKVPSPADEPALYTGGAMAAFAAVLTMLTSFDVLHWTNQQQAAAAGVAVIVLPALQGLITRQWVRPVSRSINVPPQTAARANDGNNYSGA